MSAHGTPVNQQTPRADTAPRRPLIVGLGKSGLSCARHLAARGRDFTIVDSRAEPPCLAALQRELPDVCPVLGGFDPALFTAAEEVILSPGVSLHEPAVVQAIDSGIPIVGDIELFAREARAPVVAVTGSNGKSTVTTLVGAMAREAGRDVRVGGNLGTPALELLQDREPELYVLELSSFQLQTAHSLRPAAAVILNVSADHFDHHRDMDEYLAAKLRIYRGDGVMVINADEPGLAAQRDPERGTVSFSTRAPVEDGYGIVQPQGRAWLSRGERLLIAADELQITGAHNWANALAALALGEAAGLPVEPMLAVLRRFTGLPHRMQTVAERGGVRWIDDSKGTNVGAAAAAVAGLEIPGRVILIAGGLGKGADFSPLRPALEGRARAVLLLGRDAPLMADALQGVAPIVAVTDMDEAVRRAAELAQPGDAVLLSPACASFDMFLNYEDRGDRFAAAVRRVLA